VHARAPNERVDPVGHYRIVSIGRLGNKNIALAHNVAAAPAITGTCCLEVDAIILMVRDIKSVTASGLCRLKGCSSG
jgi:hypothetical protein